MDRKRRTSIACQHIPILCHCGNHPWNLNEHFVTSISSERLNENPPQFVQQLWKESLCLTAPNAEDKLPQFPSTSTSPNCSNKMYANRFVPRTFARSTYALKVSVFWSYFGNTRMMCAELSANYPLLQHRTKQILFKGEYAFWPTNLALSKTK